MIEQFANNAATTLNGGISAAATTLVVQSAALFPGSGYFRLAINAERLLVTAVSGTTWTITRGIEGTTPAEHADGDAVELQLTAGAIATLRPVFKKKDNDESVAASTTLQSDNDLGFTVNPNEVWVARWVLGVDAPLAAQIKVGITVPSGTYRLHILGPQTSEAAAPWSTAVDSLTSGSAAMGTGGAGVVVPVYVDALIRVGATGGTVTLQWAQNASNGTPTIVKADSYLLAHLVV
jgi:hypothetical protein